MSGLSVASIWNYFEKIQNKTVAKCILCKKQYSYKTSITNLKKHLSYKHLSALRNFMNARSGTSAINGVNTPENGQLSAVEHAVTEEGSSLQSEPVHPAELQTVPPGLRLTRQTNSSKQDDDDESNSSVKFSSEIWRQFEQEGSHSRCTNCQQTTENTIESMKSHLEEDHPGILIGILHSKPNNTTNPIDEEEGDGDTFTEVVYLEDELNRHRPTKKRKPATKQTKPDGSKVVPAYPERPEIDTFLSYVGVLLRTVPKETLPKLQLDVISLILNATMANASKEPIVTLSNDGNYQINIQNEDVSGS